MPQIDELGAWLAPALLLSGGLLLGIVAEKVILPLLLKASRRVHLDSASLVMRSVKGMLILWGSWRV